MECEKFYDYLDYWISLEVVKLCKFYSCFFEVSLEKFGLKLENVMFVGDFLEYDVNGVFLFGMCIVLIKNGDEFVFF